MSNLEITTREAAHGATVIELSGRLAGGSAEKLEDELRRLEDAGRVKLVVSCRALEFLSSEASSVFLSHLMRFKKAGGDIRFCDVPESTRSSFETLGLSRLLVSYESEDSALEGYREAEAPAGHQEPGGDLTITLDELPEGVAVLAAVGSIDRHTIELLDARLMEALQAGHVKVIIDGSELNYVNSSGMGVFISYLSKFNAQGGDLRFCALNDLVRTVVMTLGLHRIFQIFDSRDEALESFQAGA